jgi:hypothetical protein
MTWYIVAVKPMNKAKNLEENKNSSYKNDIKEDKLKYIYTPYL